MKVCRLAALLALLPLTFAADQTAAQLSSEGARAERNGDIERAYILYSEAAAKDPKNGLVWLRAQALRPLVEAKQRQVASQHAGAKPAGPIDPSIVGAITDQEIEESRKLLPPPQLEGEAGRKDFDLRGDSKALFEQVARAFGLEPVFDPGYQPKTEMRLQLTDSDYRDALRALEAATDSFIVPATRKRFLVANDTTQKRTELDRTASVVIPAPEPVTVQQIQEIATGVRGTLDIQRLMVDTNRRLILLRDRVAKVQLAEKIIEDLMKPAAQVAIEVQLMEVDENSSLNYGLSLPTSFPLVWFGAPNSKRVTTNYPSGFTSYLGFGGGKSRLGLGITSSELFARVSKGLATTILQSEVLASEGQPVSLHVGDKYPIVTNEYLGSGNTGGATVYTPPPTINFEDLGLLMKITPHAHGMEEITLEVEAEFKLLGSSSIDNIPVISSRKFQSKVRLANGEWAVLAGLMTDTEGKTISGLAGLSAIPLLRNNTITRTHGQTLIILKPHLLNLPPTESTVKAAWVGTETRPRSAL